MKSETENADLSGAEFINSGRGAQNVRPEDERPTLVARELLQIAGMALMPHQRDNAESRAGFTLIEVLFAVAIFSIASVAFTGLMLHMNRKAATMKVLNAAKARALSSIQEVSGCSFDPLATPAVVPAIMATGTRTTSVNLGDASTDLGALPATQTWTVAAVGTAGTRSIRCRIDYQYLGKPQRYELFTYKAPD